MKVFRNFITLMLVAGVVINATAQSNQLVKAQAAYDAQKYAEAITLFKEAYKKEKDKANKAEIIFKTANCYRTINEHKQAETWYRKAIRVKYPDPLVHLYYAEAMKQQGKYEEAIVEFNQYSELASGDPRGANGAESCALAKGWIENPTRYEVENVAQINGRLNDFSPTYASKNYKELVFTSSRDDASGKEVDGWTGESFTDLFETKLDRKGKWSKPSPLDVTINSVYNEGASALTTKGNTMYFTRCAKAKKEAMGCDIYKSKAQGSKWSEPELLPFFAAENADTTKKIITNGHPAISSDETILIFASDNPEGSMGGKDLWMSKWDEEKKRWGKPTNLGATINTPGDEMYPFLHEDGTLYFSSNGHVGMGGWDILKAEKLGEGSWGSVANMRYPINSSGDDFGIIFEREAEKGYFTSNRDGGKGGDDIYSFILPQLVFSLQGVVTNAKSNAAISGATVTIVGTDGASLETTTDGSGFYKFDISPATSYVITASHPDYLNKNGKTTTVGLEEDKALVHDFQLAPIDKPIELPNIYYDLGKWELRPESKVSLDGLVTTLNENPTIVIELASHTDSRASDSYNLTLSQKRAQSVVDYLIENGIEPERLVAKGYGESKPRVIDRDFSFFKKGDVLNEAFIGKFKADDPKFEEAHQLNRRTEFSVLRKDFVPKEKPKQ